MSKPTISEYIGLQNFLNNYEPLVRSEMEWIQNRDDLVTLRPGRPPSHLEAFLGPRIRFYSRKRVERAATILLILIMLSFIVVPIWMLTSFPHRTHAGYAIAIITVSILLFCSMLSLFTKTRRHELLGAGAAYVGLHHCSNVSANNCMQLLRNSGRVHVEHKLVSSRSRCARHHQQ